MNCDIIRRDSANYSDRLLGCLSCDKAMRSNITAQCDGRPRGYKGYGPQRADSEGERKLVCRQALRTVRGPRGRRRSGACNIWVGCGSKRQMRVMSKRRGGGSVGNSTAGPGWPRCSWYHRCGRSAATSSAEARSPTRTRRQDMRFFLNSKKETVFGPGF